MLRTINLVLLMLILSFGLVIFNSTTAMAGEFDQRYYLGLQASNIWLEGDFDELEENVGGGLVFGATKDIYTCELSYSQSEHDFLDGTLKSTADLETLNVSVKIYPPSLINEQSRPYGLIGWGITKLSVKDGFKFEGNGFHLGFGMNCKINKKIAIDGSIAYYRYGIDKIKDGESEEEPPKGDVEMINTVASLGLQYYF